MATPSIKWRRLALVLLPALLILTVSIGTAIASEAKPGKPSIHVYQNEEDLVIGWNPADDGVNVNKWLVQAKYETEGVVKRRWVKGTRSRLVIEDATPGDYKIRVRGKNNAGVGPVSMVEFHVSDMILRPLSDEEWEEMRDELNE